MTETPHDPERHPYLTELDSIAAELSASRFPILATIGARLSECVVRLTPPAPRVVSTADELDALPVGTVVIDGTGWRASQKHGGGQWWRTADVNPVLGGRTSDTLLRYGPCTVVWTP